MYCKNCGKEISDSAKFCRYCGTSVMKNDISNKNNETESISQNGKNIYPGPGHGNKTSNHLLYIWITIAIFIIVGSVFIIKGCAEKKSQNSEQGYVHEIKDNIQGQWKTSLYLSDYIDDLDSIEQGILELIAGNLSFDIITSFNQDNSFSYRIDTEKIVDAISDAMSGAVGLFIDIDVSSIVSDLIEDALDDALPDNLTGFSGTYKVLDNGQIIADCETTIYFELNGDTLIQTDEYGNEICRFWQN